MHRPSFLTKKAATEIRQDLERRGIKKVNIGGGEPFLNPNFKSILPIFKDFDVTVSTNGSLLDNEAIYLISKYAGNVLMSIDGPEQIHDMIRSSGAFKRTSASIKKLKSEGVRLKLNFTFVNPNKGYVNDFVRFGKEVEADRLSISRYIPFDPQYLPSYGEHEALIKAWQEIKKGLDIPLILDGGLLRVFGVQKGECKLGNTIDFSNGKVYPCPWLRQDLKTGVEGIEGLKCRECPDFSSCGGGCRGAAFAAFGRIDERDPLCRYLNTKKA
jgi:MoaA/NifB/PqqE/SkfB family radical SAM enzyme